MQTILAVASGAVVGLSLGVIGGGGSILAVPLLVYAVGMKSPHHAIGTSAVAVAASAVLGLAGHAKARNVKWPCAVAFAVFGIAGAAAGAHIGKLVDGEKLLGLFGLLMIAVAGLMLWRPTGGEAAEVRLDIQSAAKLLPPLAAAGLAVGFVSGFFGIGGGFLIVPGLVGATAMPLLNAIGSSLVSVATFGTTTAISYAASGLVDWEIAGLFILGGALGAAAGTWLAGKLAPRKKLLNRVFAGVVAATGIYVAARGFAAVA
jgi:uncharacterized membrane protein YfcA